MHSTKVIASIVLLISVIIAASFYSSKILESSSKKMEGYIDIIETNAREGKWETAGEGLTLIESDWEKTERTWSMLIDHIEVDNIETSVKRLAKYIETRNQPLSLAEAANLRQYVTHIPQKEALFWENIF